MFKFLGLRIMTANEYETQEDIRSAYAGLVAAYKTREKTADELIAAQRALIANQDTMLDEYRAILFPNKKVKQSNFQTLVQWTEGGQK